MSLTALNQTGKSRPLAFDLATLGRLIRHQRLECCLDLQDTAEIIDVNVVALTNVEEGRPVDTACLFKVLGALGLAMLVMPSSDAEDALECLGHVTGSYQATETQSAPRTGPVPNPLHMPLVLDNLTPTLFVDFDGTLHAGTAYLDDRGKITLDSGRPALEFAPLLEELLAGYPKVEIVLTTSWLQTMPEQKVFDALPFVLRHRIAGTTGDIKPRWSYLLAGIERTDVIIRYAVGKRSKHWLSIDDAVRGIEQFGFRERGELVDHFILLDPTVGISDRHVLSRIEKWLADVHAWIGGNTP